MALNEGQQKVLESILKGDNVFVTGAAGVGKSHLIRQVTLSFDTEGKSFALLAPTGVAAVNIGGQTIHKFASLQPEISNIADYVRICYKRVKKGKWQQLDAIIIDEVSMVHPELLELVDEIAQLHRQSTKPFGGIQVILIGDFFQLPYVPNRGDTSKGFLFDTNVWRSLNLVHHEMNQVMRQKDNDFIDALNDLRKGLMTDRVSKMLLKCSKNKKNPEKHYVKLCAVNAQKARENELKLSELKSQEKLFKSLDIGDKKYLNGCRADEKVLLKVGAPVMLLWNMPEFDLCNGSIGVVEEFVESGYPRVRFNNGQTVLIMPQTWKVSERKKKGFELLASRKQVPLVVAYSISQHKSQGLTLDYLEVDCSAIFTTGQLYTALSRASSPEGLIIKKYNPNKVLVDGRVVEFYKDFKSICSVEDDYSIPMDDD